MINMQSFDPKTLTDFQLRAARALVGWSAQELATRAALGVATVRRAEQRKGAVAMNAANAEAVVRALQQAGVIFIAENGGGPGVRLARQAQTNPTGRKG
jgi:hypothetical protein